MFVPLVFNLLQRSPAGRDIEPTGAALVAIKSLVRVPSSPGAVRVPVGGVRVQCVVQAGVGFQGPGWLASRLFEHDA